MGIGLDGVLALVGKLDDSPGADTPRERFRRFLGENVKETGQVRDYVQECLRTSGDQYNRALQDLVNHIGHLLGFEVTFGRYQGVQKHIGFDGHWQSPSGFHIVIEVKTTEAYAIKAATLVHYVDELISDRLIPDWDKALGLYVVGRPDPEIRQLENAILAEKRTDKLRIISVESLLSLAELMTQYDTSHGDILGILRPSGPTIDPVVDLMTRLAAPRQPEVSQPKLLLPSTEPPLPEETTYWLTPVKSDEEASAEETVQALVGEEKIYAFGDRTPGRKRIKPGDWICFYATTKGVIAHAKVASAPEKGQNPKVRHPDMYPWLFGLTSVRLYTDTPIVIDAALRTRLDAFTGRDPDKGWAWFVQATRSVSAHDLAILTGQASH